MSDAGRSLIARWVPGWLKAARHRVIGCRQFSGDYATWAAALRASTGYDRPEIVRTVLEATLAARAGGAGFERDGVVLRTGRTEPELTACLDQVALAAGRLNVLDVGGSLGTTYWRHRQHWANVPLAWTVVEQPGFVRAGRDHLADSPLRFFETVSEAWASGSHDVLLASTSLQYFESPHEAVAQWRALRPAWILLNNLPLLEAPRDRLVVQRVPKAIYSASYPVWLLSRERFVQALEGYELVRMFRSEAVWQLGWKRLPSTGLFYRRLNP